jgi:hypothetical protein
VVAADEERVGGVGLGEECVVDVTGVAVLFGWAEPGRVVGDDAVEGDVLRYDQVSHELPSSWFLATTADRIGSHRPARLRGIRGDEFRAWFGSVSTHPWNRPRGEHMTATYTFDVFSSLDGYGSNDSSSDWGGYWGKQGPELLDHRLALYSGEQRMVFGANTYRQFVEMLGSAPRSPTCVTHG